MSWVPSAHALHPPRNTLREDTQSGDNLPGFQKAVPKFVGNKHGKGL